MKSLLASYAFISAVKTGALNIQKNTVDTNAVKTIEDVFMLKI